VRKGFNDGADIVHTWLPQAASWGAVAATIHGRTRQQRCAPWLHVVLGVHASVQPGRVLCSSSTNWCMLVPWVRHEAGRTLTACCYKVCVGRGSEGENIMCQLRHRTDARGCHGKLSCRPRIL